MKLTYASVRQGRSARGRPERSLSSVSRTVAHDRPSSVAIVPIFPVLGVVESADLRRRLRRDHASPDIEIGRRSPAESTTRPVRIPEEQQLTLCLLLGRRPRHGHAGDGEDLRCGRGFGRVIHHPPPFSQRPLVVPMIRSAFRTLLVAKPGRAQLSLPGRLPARLGAVLLAPVAPATQKEELPAPSAPPHPQRVSLGLGQRLPACGALDVWPRTWEALATLLELRVVLGR